MKKVEADLDEETTSLGVGDEVPPVLVRPELVHVAENKERRSGSSQGDVHSSAGARESATLTTRLREGRLTECPTRIQSTFQPILLARRKA